VLRVLRAKDAKTTVVVGFTHEDGYPRKAEIDFTDNQIDPKTGTLRVKATWPNQKGELLPGMFVRVRLPLGSPRKALLVPDAAVVRTPGNPLLLVVNDKNKLVERAVRLGSLVDGLRVIEEGIGADDWVVLDPRGRQSGEEIRPRREAAPPAGAKPDGLRFGAGSPRPLPEFPGAGPALVIVAKYPGANSTVVEQTVATPIDAQLNGLEGTVHRFVACSDDGEMRLTVTFPRGTDLDKAATLAQTRVALAEPTLPEEVRRAGITIKKRPAHLLTLALVAPDATYDRAFLAGYASARLRDELARVSGVADTTFYGDSDPSPQVRVELDRDKAAAYGVTATDVMKAVREERERATSVPGVRLTSPAADPEKLGLTVIKSDKGSVIYLRDVARLELESGWSTTTVLDGKPCVMLLVSRTADADPRATAKAVRAKLADLAKSFPAGLECKVIGEEP